MSDTQFDIIIAGGGPAGLAAALLLASAGRHVALVSGALRGGEDPRTVALMQPAIQLLARLDIWPGDLAANAAPLKKLRLVDDTSSLISAPDVTFDATELGDTPFGWNIPLGRLVPALKAAVERANVTCFACDAAGFETSLDYAAIRLSDRTSLSAKLVIAADGRESQIRQASGVRVEEWSYDQSAIATSFTHSVPHRGISTERHRPGGPFTTVPLPGNRSSLVWMERPETARKLMALSDDALASEIQLATRGELGRIGEVGPRRVFPMRGLRALQLTSQRLILVGEAAHVVPPIGAQGLNMSFRDIAEMFDIIGQYSDPGSPEALRAYASARETDLRPRQAVIDLLNNSLLADMIWLNSFRAGVLTAISAFPPLRRFAMWRGLQPPGRRPAAMQKPA